MPATVVDGVTAAMNLYRDESFGPVVAMIRARDAEHAVELANDTEYGLSAAVFTRDIARGLDHRPAHPVGHLPRQRTDRPRRGADAVWRRRRFGLWPVRRAGRASTASPKPAGSRSKPSPAISRSEEASLGEIETCRRSDGGHAGGRRSRGRVDRQRRHPASNLPSPRGSKSPCRWNWARPGAGASGSSRSPAARSLARC